VLKLQILNLTQMVTTKKSFSVNLTTPEEICDIVKLIPPKSSAGPDDIPVHIMKLATPSGNMASLEARWSSCARR